MINTSTASKCIKRFSEKGITLLEALISTAIVGIGFVAVFQLVNFSVNSINVSAERTKINYITTMIAEDIIGSRDTLVGVNPKTNTITIDNYGKPVNADGSRSEKVKFAEHNKMAGVESNAMLLAADINDKPFWLTVDSEVPPGTKIK